MAANDNVTGGGVNWSSLVKMEVNKNTLGAKSGVAKKNICD